MLGAAAKFSVAELQALVELVADEITGKPPKIEAELAGNVAKLVNGEIADSRLVEGEFVNSDIANGELGVE